MAFGISNQGSDVGGIEQRVGEYPGRRETAGERLERVLTYNVQHRYMDSIRQVSDGIGRERDLLEMAM